MDLSKISKLKIIPTNKDTAPILSTELKSVEASGQPENTDNIPPTKLKVIENKYNDLRRGNLSVSDFNRKLYEIDRTLLDTIDKGQKKLVEKYLYETLQWYIQLKLLISTGLNIASISDLAQSNSDSKLAKDFAQFIPSFNHMSFDSNLDDVQDFNAKSNVAPKEASLNIIDFLKVFINDDIMNPMYKINNEMVMYLHNNRPGFLNEITVLIDLYSKFYGEVSKDLIEDRLNNPLRSLSDIQPRFEMINRHILYTLQSNLPNKINFDIELNKLNIGKENENLSIYSSQYGLSKRLTLLNNWLINAIISTQTSINRLKGLKPITKEGKQKDSLDFSSQPATTRYDIWLILQDTKAILESLKGLVDGTAFLTGVPSGEMLDVLNVNY